MAAITGGIAEAKFGVPKAIEATARSYLSKELDGIVSRFAERVGRGAASTERDAKERQVAKWLADNVTVIGKVQSVILSKFTWNAERYEGEFYVTFDGVEYPRSFDFSLGGSDGLTNIYTPMFTSPLRVPASFEAIDIPSNVMRLISHEIRTLFPRIEPYGVNRGAGKETHSSTPIHERLPDPDGLLKAVEVITDLTTRIAAWSCDHGPPCRFILSEITRKRIRRDVFHSVVELQMAINDYLEQHNANPKPFVWAASASSIIEKINRGKRALESQH